MLLSSDLLLASQFNLFFKAALFEITNRKTSGKAFLALWKSSGRGVELILCWSHLLFKILFFFSFLFSISVAASAQQCPYGV